MHWKGLEICRGCAHKIQYLTNQLPESTNGMEQKDISFEANKAPVHVWRRILVPEINACRPLLQMFTVLALKDYYIGIRNE